jgi:hypothetical protein
LYAYNYNGTLISGFPKIISDSTAVQSSPIIADLDDDGLGEISIGSPDGMVYSFNGDGTNTAGFPLTIGGKTLSTPLAAEIDGDATDTELLIGCDDGKFYAWSLDAAFRSQANNWPMFAGIQTHQGYLNWDLSLRPAKAASSDFLGDPYVYPNPAKGKSARIRYYLEKNAQVQALVFNLAGDLIRSYNQEGLAMAENEIVWSFENMAPGVYIISVRASDGSIQKTKNCKAAVLK